MKKISKKLYVERIENLYRLLVMIAIAISFFVYIFSESIILYTFGEGYKESIGVLDLYIWSILFVFLNNGSWKWYIAERLQKYAFIRLGLGALINIGLNSMWIDEYGLKGAAYATIVSYAVATYVGNLFHRKTVENFVMQTKAIITFYIHNINII